jgi:hypothetical protein
MASFIAISRHSYLTSEKDLTWRRRARLVQSEGNDNQPSRGPNGRDLPESFRAHDRSPRRCLAKRSSSLGATPPE